MRPLNSDGFRTPVNDEYDNEEDDQLVPLDAFVAGTAAATPVSNLPRSDLYRGGKTPRGRRVMRSGGPVRSPYESLQNPFKELSIFLSLSSFSRSSQLGLPLCNVYYMFPQAPGPTPSERTPQTYEGPSPGHVTSDRISAEAAFVWGTNISIDAIEQRFKSFVEGFHEPGEPESKYMTLLNNVRGGASKLSCVVKFLVQSPSPSECDLLFNLRSPLLSYMYFYPSICSLTTLPTPHAVPGA